MGVARSCTAWRTTAADQNGCHEATACSYCCRNTCNTQGSTSHRADVQADILDSGGSANGERRVWTYLVEFFHSRLFRFCVLPHPPRVHGNIPSSLSKAVTFVWCATTPPLRLWKYLVESFQSHLYRFVCYHTPLETTEISRPVFPEPPLSFCVISPPPLRPRKSSESIVQSFQSPHLSFGV